MCSAALNRNVLAALSVQASQLEALRVQLQQELTNAKQRLQELGAAQDGLMAQVGLTGGVLRECATFLGWWLVSTGLEGSALLGRGGLHR